jgi:hypothetical protein
MYCHAASWLSLDLKIPSAEPPSLAERMPPGVQAGSGTTPQSPFVFGASQLFRKMLIHWAIGSVATLAPPIEVYQGSVHSAWSPSTPACHIFPMNWSAFNARGSLSIVTLPFVST